MTNNGWRNHTDQVGQTGTRIAPTVYLACGISGAIQHWVGAMAAKHIIAVNPDPQANMVTKAGYAVIGDLHEVVPAISAEIRRRRRMRAVEPTRVHQHIPLGASLLALGSGAVWSFGAITARLADGADAFQYLIWRSIAIFLVIEAVARLRQRPPVTPQAFRTGPLMLLACACLLLASIAFVYAVKNTRPANAAFLASITPLVAVVLARFTLGERLTRGDHRRRRRRLRRPAGHRRRRPRRRRHARQHRRGAVVCRLRRLRRVRPLGRAP